MNIYVDSDVIISSLLSQKGASHFLLGRKIKRKVIFYISIYSKKELEKVVERLDIPKKELQKY